MQSSALATSVLALALAVTPLCASAAPGSGSAWEAVPPARLILAGAASASEAAEQARRQTGGQVLSVRQSGRGYEVKILTPSGEVRMVFIPGSG